MNEFVRTTVKCQGPGDGSGMPSLTSLTSSPSARGSKLVIPCGSIVLKPFRNADHSPKAAIAQSGPSVSTEMTQKQPELRRFKGRQFEAGDF